MQERSVDARAEVVTVRCERCADRDPGRSAPALAVLELDVDQWRAKTVAGRASKRAAAADAQFFGAGAGRARLEPVRSGAKGVELECRTCGLRRRIKLARLYALAEGARARRSGAVHVGAG